MNTIMIIAGAVVALGACLRWSAAPTVAAYRIGRELGRWEQAAKVAPDACQPRSFAAEVALAVLVPWRSARLIRSQHDQLHLMIRVAGKALEERSAALARAAS